MLPLNSDFIKKSLKSVFNDINSGKFSSAVQKIHELSKVAPRNDVLYFELGRIYILTDEFPLAVHNLQTAILLNPKEPILWQALLNAVILGLDADHKAEYRNKIKNSPISGSIKQKLLSKFDKKYRAVTLPHHGVPIAKLNELGKLLSLKQMEKLVQQAEKLLLDFPNAAGVLSYLGAAQFAKKQYDLALASFLKARDLAPDCAEIYSNIGGVYVAQDNIKEALGQYKEAFIRDPNSISIMNCLADAYFVLKKYPIAIKYLEKLSESVLPTSTSRELITKLGLAYLEIDNNPKAVEVLSRLEKFSDVQNLDALAMLATAQQGVMRNGDALLNAEKVLAKDPKHIRASTIRAVILQHSGKFEEAREAFKYSIKLDPNRGASYKSYVTGQKILAGDPIIDEMASIIKNEALPDVDKMNLCFALSKAYEDTKNYDKVFKYLNEASRIMLDLYPFDINLRVRDTQNLKKAFSKACWNQKELGLSQYSPIFVTGIPRSGTTLIEQIISSHSDVFGAGELGYFNDETEHAIYQLNYGQREIADIQQILDNKHEKNSKLSKVGENYQKRVEDLFPGKMMITDKAIGTYLYIGFVKAIFSNAKIIVVRREPRDNLLSIYKNMFKEGTHRYAYDFEDLAIFYDTFVQMVDFWREHAPGSFYEVQYEDLVANPEVETRKLIEACNLPWEEACLNPQNNERTVKTLSTFQVRQPISATSVASWKRYESELSVMFNKLRELGHIN